MSSTIHSKKKAKKTIRNFRIRDAIWQDARTKADDLGVNMTFVVECLLHDFAKTPRLIIGEPEVMDVPRDMEPGLDELARLADETVKEKKHHQK